LLPSTPIPPFIGQAGTVGGSNSGRITALVAVPSGAHAGRVVAGTAGGGVWTFDPNSLGWVPRSDAAPSLAIGSLAEDPANPDHLIAGMGEANAAGDDYYGFGVLSSTDGGSTWAVQNPTFTSPPSKSSYSAFTAVDASATWAKDQWAGSMVVVGTDSATVATNSATTLTLQGAWSQGTTPAAGSAFTVSTFTGAHIGAVAIDPTNPQKMYAGTNTGLFITTNGGSTWARPTSPKYAAAVGGVGTEVDAIVVNPATPTTIYIGARGAIPVAESTDGGSSVWYAANACPSCPGGSITPNPTAGASAFVALAIAPSNPNILWASLGQGQAATCCPVAVYQTNTGGNALPPGPTWSQVTTAPDYTGDVYAYGSCLGPGGTICEQGGYDNVIAVDPTNANHVVAGGETVVETLDGGATPWKNVNGVPFNQSSNNPLHPDQHALAFRPDGKIWIGNDGGVYLYDPSAATNAVTNANGTLQLALVQPTPPEEGLNITQFYPGFSEPDGSIYAGSQDNGGVHLYSPSQICAYTARGVSFVMVPGSCRTPPPPWPSQGAVGNDAGAFAVVSGPGSCGCAAMLQENNQRLWYTNDDFQTGHFDTPTVPAGDPIGINGRPPVLALANPSDWTNPTVFWGGDGVYRTTDPSATTPTWTAVARNYTSSATTSFGANTATDLNASVNWTPGQWQNYAVYADPCQAPTPPCGESAIVQSNTNNKLTLATPWTTIPTGNTVFALGFASVSAFAASGNQVYAGFNDGRVMVSADAGVTFNPLAGQPFTCAPCGTRVSGMSVDPTNPQAITASFANEVTTRTVYRVTGNVEVAQYSYTTSAQNGTWTDITGNLASIDNNATVSRVIYDQGALVAATDSGVYGTTAPAGQATVWSRVGAGLPNVQVQDLAVDPSTHDLFAVTHGRGAWKLASNGALAWGYASAGALGDGSFTGPSDPGGVCPSNISCAPVAVTNLTAGSPLRNVKAVASGWAHNMALLSNGTEVTFGLNMTGELGNGTTTNSDVPVQVCAVGATAPCGSNVLTDVVAIAGDGGTDHAAANNAGFSLALLKDGTVVAWGLNDDGELGDGSITDSSIPVRVCAVGASVPCGTNVLSGVKAIAAGGGHSLALLQNGTVVAWGYNADGQLGDGTFAGPQSCYGGDACSTTPVPVANLSGVTEISAGELHSLAALKKGTVMAWGRGNDGQLGNGTGVGSDVPIPVCAVGATAPCGTHILKGVMAIAAGGRYSLILLANTTVVSFGDDTVGELGYGGYGTGTNKYVPVQVCAVGATAPCGSDILTGVSSIAAGGGQSFAIVNDVNNSDAVRAWGAGGDGQLANGDSYDQPVPVPACQPGTPSSFTPCGATNELTGISSIAAGGVQSIAIGG
jgi:alpha-tubulin suppressor-like RCC1 family protein